MLGTVQSRGLSVEMYTLAAATPLRTASWDQAALMSIFRVSRSSLTASLEARVLRGRKALPWTQYQGQACSCVEQACEQAAATTGTYNTPCPMPRCSLTHAP